MKNFKSYVKRLQQHMRANPDSNTLQIGKGDGAWTMIFCPKSGAYYAMSGASGTTISSTIAVIRQAYRIDPKTGKPWSVAKHSVNGVNGNPIFAGTEKKPRLFAVKEFTQINDKATAEAELNALVKYQFAENEIIMNNGKPLFISDFFPGQMLVDDTGQLQLNLALSLTDRINIILQLAIQLHRIHSNTREGGAMLHRDVKPQNTIVHAPDNNNAKKNAFIIDFGSAVQLEETETVPVYDLGGLSSYAIPPEAIEKLDPEITQLEAMVDSEEIGYLDRKSDIYAMGPVFASILGANRPYQFRLESIANKNNYDVGLLRTQIDAGFDFSEVLNADIPGSDFEITDNRACGFRNKQDELKPADEQILHDQENELPDVCYVYYKNKLVYVDKLSNKVISVSLTQTERIPSTPDNDNLDDEQLASLGKFIKHQKNSTADSLLRPLIRIFLESMVDTSIDQRPTTDEVLQFFNITQRLCHVRDVRDERAFQIGIMQLQLILIREWSSKIPVEHLDFEAPSFAPLSTYDFTLLEQDEDKFNLLKSEIVNIDASSRDFSFLKPKSYAAKVYDLVLYKLSTKDEDHQLFETLKVIAKRTTEPLIAERLIGEFGDLSTAMLKCLITKNVPDDFLENVEIAQEFTQHMSLIKLISNDVYATLISQKKSLHSDKLPANITQLMTSVLNLSESDKLNFSSTEDLVDFLFEIRAQQEEIIAGYSDKTYEIAVASLCKELVKDLHEYLKSIEHIKDNTYQRFSFLGMAGYKVGDKRKAVEALIHAIQTGNFDPLHDNHRMMNALKQGKLGDISKVFVDKIESKSQHGHN